VDIKAYKQTYHHFTVALDQTRLISLCAAHTLHSFPQNLPEPIRGGVATLLQRVGQELLTFLDEAKLPCGEPPVEREPRQRNIPLTLESDELTQQVTAFLSPTLSMMIAHQCSQLGSRLDFRQLIYSQEVAMVIAHLYAFLSDSLRAMCAVQPALLNRKKTISWEDVLGHESLDAIRQRLTEEYCYELGHQGIADQLEHLRTKHGLEFDVAEDHLQRLSEAELLRHLIIHNGGRVNQDYRRRTKQHDLGIGSVIPVTAEIASAVNGSALAVGSVLFRAIAATFFRATEDQLTGVRSYSPKVPFNAIGIMLSKDDT
jgi:hypothetical protein